MKKLIAVILALLFLTVAFMPVVVADAGDFAGDYDFGGGGDWGGGGYWDDDDDDDGFGIVDVVVDLILEILSSNPFLRRFVLIPGSIGLVIFIIVISIRKGSKRKTHGSSTVSSPSYSRNYINVGDRSTPQSKLTSMSKYKELDPDFSEDKIKSKMSNIYVQMQNNWTKKDFSPMRPYFSDELYTQFERQLQQKIDQHVTNHIDRISVQFVELRGYFQESGLDHIIVKLQTKIVIYTVDDKTGNIIAGSQSQEKFMTYEWDITRTTGMKTQKDKKDSLGRSVCPSCGAPLDINASARCTFCGSVINSSEHDWVISHITALSQKTV